MGRRYFFKFVVFVVLVVVFLMIVRQPEQSADRARDAGGGITQISDSIGTFLDNVFAK